MEMYTINRATDNPGKETEIVVEPLKESLIEKKNNSKARFQKKNSHGTPPALDIKVNTFSGTRVWVQIWRVFLSQ